MIATLDTLWKTFGVTGGLSVAAWLAALAWLAIGIRPGRRWQAWLKAAAAAAVGLGLALMTSESIRSIEVDRSQEVAAAEAAAAQATQKKLEGRAVGIRFAEDTDADRADLAGVTAAEAEGAYERAVEEELEKMPAYRRRGKQSRGGKAATSGTAAASGTAASGTAADVPAGEEAATAAPDSSVRMLPEAQLMVADRYDRANRLISWAVLGLAVGLCGFEYVRRFNTTFDAVWPLPLAGTLIDGMATKDRVVAVPPGLAGGLERFLEIAVRKGETFLLFAAADPLPGRDSLDRLSVGPAAWRLPKRSFSAAEVAADPELARLVFESAWFDRAAFVLAGEPGSKEVLTSIIRAILRRRYARAAMRHTLNLVWALPSEPPAAVVAELTRLAGPVNYRWLRASPPA